MGKGILGRKVGMTQVFDAETGEVSPVTVIQAGPCRVLQIKTPERDRYSAVQLGFVDKKRPIKDRRSRASQASRAERGHVADPEAFNSKRYQRRVKSGTALPPKANCEPQRYVRELRGTAEGLEVGQLITVATLEGVASVDVIGTTKGRGYSGVMKRHGFAGQRATHGVKKVHRHPGGTGSLAAWRGGGRPKKGKRMAGQYGNTRVTARNLKLVRIDADQHVLLVRGAVPGPNGGLVVVRESNIKR